MQKLTDIQVTSYEIMKELKKICEKNSIQYFVLGGTLLGCVRHKGFIPWDDDIDVGFLRKDYERLLKLLAKIDSENELKLSTYETVEEHISYFAKLTSNRMSVIKNRGGKKVKLDVWVDLFPLDGLPNGKLARLFYCKYVMFWKLLYKFSLIDNIQYDTHRSKMHNFLIWVGKVLHLNKVLPYTKILEKIDRLLKKYPLEKSDYIGNLMGAWSEREVFPKNYFLPSKKYQFEDELLNGPNQYDAILTQMYGDYMTPPARDNRNHHNLETPIADSQD